MFLIRKDKGIAAHQTNNCLTKVQQQNTTPLPFCRYEWIIAVCYLIWKDKDVSQKLLTVTKNKNNQQLCYNYGKMRKTSSAEDRIRSSSRKTTSVYLL